MRKRSVKSNNNLPEVSIKNIKRKVSGVSFLSDDMVIASIDAQTTNMITRPIVFNGLSAIIIMGGEARIEIDAQDYIIRERDIVVFSPNTTLNVVSCTEDAAAYLTSFSESFIKELKVGLSTTLPIYMRLDKNPIIHLCEDDVSKIRELFQLIKRVIGDSDKCQTEIIKSLLTAMFYILTDLNSRDGVEDIRKGRCEVIFNEFLTLLDKHSSTERNVKFYADQLEISTKYLSAVIKDVSGKSAAKWIDEAVVLEAKSLLLYSSLSINEIAEKLNFSTQSFFGKYFKQHTGFSPSKFKKNG